MLEADIGLALVTLWCVVCGLLRDDVLQDSLHDELLTEVPRQVMLGPLL